MKPCLFLDRDGVINVDSGYAYRPSQIRFMLGIFALCRFFQHRGFLIIIVTNQSGIARQYYTEADFHHLNTWMIRQFLMRGVKIKAIYHCPHHPAITGSCDCRKPNPGMFLNAIKKYRISEKQSIMIGDNPSDMEAARSAGVATRILIGQHQKVAKGRALETLSFTNLHQVLTWYRQQHLAAMEKKLD